MTATLRGVPLALSPLEYRLLAYLALHRDRVVRADRAARAPLRRRRRPRGERARGAGRPPPPQARRRRRRHPPRLRLLPRIRRAVKPRPRSAPAAASPPAGRRSLVVAGARRRRPRLPLRAPRRRLAVVELSADLDQLAAGLERRRGRRARHGAAADRPALRPAPLRPLLAGRDRRRRRSPRARSGTRRSRCRRRRRATAARASSASRAATARRCSCSNARLRRRASAATGCASRWRCDRAELRAPPAPSSRDLAP